MLGKSTHAPLRHSALCFYIDVNVSASARRSVRHCVDPEERLPVTPTSLHQEPASADPLLDVQEYSDRLGSWLGANPATLAAVTVAMRAQRDRIAAMRALMGVLYDAGWSRYGWPAAVGGLGGTIAHRAAMWDLLARHRVPGMELFEHLEVLMPTLVELGRAEFVSHALPAFLAGDELWAQGFSEPEAGSDLATVRTTARPVDGGFAVNGRKIWTSWATHATWCLVLARTGTPESRHRGLTAFAVDLRDPGVEVRAIEQANGNNELTEVTFDDVPVPAGRIVGEVDGGWAVAMHILSHERGTFAWFRQCFLYEYLQAGLPLGAAADDTALGNALLDTVAVSAAAHAAVEAHAAHRPLGPKATFTKLLLCAAEQSINDWILCTEPELTIDLDDDEVAVRRQEYLFSRIVTVYGGSQQMQLETIAKQILRLP